MVIDKVLIIASAIIKNDKGELLLLERGETKTFQKHWQLPEGKLEAGENPQEALTRELQEEINAETVSLELLAVNATPLEAKGAKYLAFRIIFDAKIKVDKIKLSDEHLNYKWEKKEDIKNLQLLPGTSEAIESII